MTRPCDAPQHRPSSVRTAAVSSSRWSSDDEDAGESPTSPSSRRSIRSILVEGIEVSGHREKLPRPLASPSVEAVYSSAGERAAESPTARSPREQNKVLLDSEKMAPRKFLWTTLDSVVVRPAEAAANLPLPLAAVCAPFADNGADSIPLSLSEVHNEDEEPVRCPRCWCYANSFWKASKRYERRLQCNMCDHHMELPEEFWQEMESVAWNPDEEHHPELAYGSVDFQAPQHFDADRPVKLRAPVTCFLLEATSAAARSGFLPAVVRTLDSLLQGPLNANDRQVGLITFDDTEVLLHVPTRTGRFRAVAMTDTEDPYVPVCPEKLFVWPDARGEDEEGDPGLADLLFQLAEVLPLQPCAVASPSAAPCRALDRSVSCTSWESPPRSSSAVARAALRVALEAVSKAGGGDVLVFSADADFTPPTAASPGSRGSSPRSPKTPTCTPKKQKSTPSLGFGFEVEATDPEIAELCVRGAVAISAVTAPEQLGGQAEVEAEVEALHWLSWRTGGEVFHFASFSPTSENELVEQLWHWSAKLSGAVYGCVFKLRCSKGLLCKSLIAPWRASPTSADQSTFEISRLTADAAATFSLLPDYEALDDDSESPADMRRELYLQAAILYTNARGERMLRVHNCTVFIVHAVRLAHTGLQLPPLVTLLFKQAALLALEDAGSFKNKVLPKDFLQEVLLKILGNYHRFSRGSSEDVLATGRKLHLLPLYVLAARKCLYSLMGGSGDKYTAEHRLRQILKMPVHSVMAALYTRVYALPAPSTEEIPPPCPAMLETIASGRSSAYLITNGFGMWFYRAKMEDPQQDPQQTDEELWHTACELGRKIYESTSPTPWALALRPLPTPMTSGATPYEKNTWQERVLLSSLFVEDKGVSDAGYAEWVQFLHEELGRKLE